MLACCHSYLQKDRRNAYFEQSTIWVWKHYISILAKREIEGEVHSNNGGLFTPATNLLERANAKHGVYEPPPFLPGTNHSKTKTYLRVWYSCKR